MSIIIRVGGLGADYARLNGDAFSNLVACAFTSKTSEAPNPNIYVSLRQVLIDADIWKESFVQHLARVIDHEMSHLLSPQIAVGDHVAWDREESVAVEFEAAGVWSRE